MSNKKKKFRLAGMFMLVLELKGFYSAASNILGHFWMSAVRATMMETSLKMLMDAITTKFY